MRTWCTSLFVLSLAFVARADDARQPVSHFTPPRARTQRVPPHDYDLQHVALDLDVDFRGLTFRGKVVNELAPTIDDLTSIALHCGRGLDVQSCTVAGREAAFTRDGDVLKVMVKPPLRRGEVVPVAVRYSGGKAGKGFYWIKADTPSRDHAGFYTEGQPDRNRNWIPTWDYPDDFATTETRVTVPADWYVVGNGVLDSDKTDASGGRRTFHWRLDRPHATYLLSLAAGPFDIKTERWQGVPLMYLVPRGKGRLIGPTFSHTSNMLEFFSTVTGVDYPWPKYAQTAVPDYRGGIENVSATTISARALSDGRGGPFASDTLVSHELAHQWFGNMVTCKDWGQLWLNEGFAMFFEALYFEHSRGRAEYDHFIDDMAREYFTESRGYQRPLATDVFDEIGSMWDKHTYAKGATVLHMLRRKLGDRAFFAGVRHYLTKYRHAPVSSDDFRSAMSDATGVDLGQFFDQWVHRPGHPVLDYTWRWDGPGHQVILTVAQEQATKGGAPPFELGAVVGLILGGRVDRSTIKLDRARQELRVAAQTRPDAVLLDPDHDLLREVPTLHWAAEEVPSILKHAPHAVDREEAMRRMLEGTPTEDAVTAVAEAIRADGGRFPVFRSLAALGDLKREALRQLLRAQLEHASQNRRAEAILALGRLVKDEDDVRILRTLINAEEPDTVVGAALTTLATWDATGNRDAFREVAVGRDMEDGVRLIALDALARARAEGGRDHPDPEPQTTRAMSEFLADVGAGTKDSPRMTPEVREFLIPRFSNGTKRILEKLGSIQLLGMDRVRLQINGSDIDRVYYYKLEGEGSSLYYIFRLKPDDRVADIDILPAPAVMRRGRGLH